VLFRHIAKFFLPGSIIFFIALFIHHSDIFFPLIPQINSIYPYAVLVVGVFMGWRFSRSRLIFTLIVLTLADQAFLRLQFDPQGDIIRNQVIYNIITLLVPANFIGISFIKERGILNLRGIGRLGLILIQPVLVYLIIKYEYISSLKFLGVDIFRISFMEAFAIGQIPLLVFLSAFIFTIVNFALKKDIVEGGFFWALLCSFMALFPGQATEVSTFYFSSAGFILIMSILEYSHNVAFKDELTGLSTRRALFESFLKLPNRYSIAMVDIDHFKKFNDQFGHDVGDQVLRMVASRLQRVNGGGKVFRYGGEEFTVVFPGKGANEARIYAENLRKSISDSPFIIRSPKRPQKKPDDLENAPKSRKQTKITISIGIAERNENLNEPDDVMKAADEALLRAKKGGRNRVRLYGKLHASEK
jgi:diguanylate cyclase (GGDEF)-like protein